MSSSRMFDWDKDYAALIGEGDTPAPQPHRPDKPALSKAADVRRFSVPMAIILLFLAATAYEKQGALRNLSGIGSGAHPVTVGARDALPEGVPPQLQVYDLQQFQRFTQGLQQMSAPDLLTYKANLRRELDAASGFMAPFHRDALFLATAEVSRRDL